MMTIMQYVAEALNSHHLIWQFDDPIIIIPMISTHITVIGG